VYYQDDGKHFGNRLREARLGAGLSQSELEELSGIPKARLSRYENGHVEPSIQTLARLARALNVSEASLLGDQRGIMEDFFNVLHERGVQITSKEQGHSLAQAVADMVTALGGIESLAATRSEEPAGGSGSAGATFLIPEPTTVL
jgi:transcriptional regulator with XRE-family HTH domain